MTEIFNKDKYYNETKIEYFFEYDCGDHVSDGVFIYQILFDKPIARKNFNKMMEKAGKCESPYSCLGDKEFQKKYHIKIFRKLPIDYHDVKEEGYD